ncbi:hypothetical protein [Laspinema olomoucense]|uniref:hypothetical protein n=1 Tax=Laspinema olomoucense TaxID=3231600 RepID=UPI0021BA95FE|nr:MULTISPECIES: hypothetical protein [unclassified Laspinema]MCT7973692.1 hypothetical protein [Laspinema sp. D3d]
MESSKLAALSVNKGFSPVVGSAKLKPLKNQPQLISMPELEGDLLNYFDDVPDHSDRLQKSCVG